MSTEHDEGSTGVAPEAPPYAGRGWSLAVIGFTAAVLAIGGSVGTKLGWPGIYWQHGGWVFWAYIAACLLFGIGSFLAVKGFSPQPPVPPSVTITLLVAVVLILKWLPPAESGIQVLPCAPWSYPGWLPFLIAIGAWIFLSFILIADSRRRNRDFFDVYAGADVATFVLEHPAPEYGTDIHSSAGSGRSACRVPKPDRRMDRANEAPLSEFWKLLRRDQQSLVERLKCLGVRSSTDLKNAPAARPLAEELAEVVAQIRDQEQEIERLSTTIIESESHVRRIERHKVIEATGLDEPEEEQLVRTGVELTEMLRSDQGDLMVTGSGEGAGQDVD